jgi:glycosyltransferase involved in cell wall biosynthesis
VPRVLWLTAEVPDRGLGGGNIRQYHLLHALSNRAEVDLALIGSLREPELRTRLRAVTEYPVPRRRSLPKWLWRLQALWVAAFARRPFEVRENRRALALLRRAARQGADYDVVCVEHHQLAPLLSRRHSNRWVLTLHNLASQISAQQAAIAPGRRQAWLWERDSARARRLEQWALDAYDEVIVVSQEDAEALGGEVTVIPNGVDLERFRPTPLPSEPRLLFSASFNYPPNVDAAQWLCDEILPLVRAEVPEVALDLVGRNPVPEVEALAATSGVELHANVPSIMPYVQAARVSVVPLRVGSGTRLKALEAMAAGRPLAGTSLGLEGVGLEPGRSAAIAEAAAGLAEAIVALLRDDERARAQAEAALEAVQPFAWERIGADFVETILGR